jgi:hypothetical protein
VEISVSGGKPAVIEACLISSPLWNVFTQLSLLSSTGFTTAVIYFDSDPNFANNYPAELIHKQILSGVLPHSLLLKPETVQQNLDDC